MPSIVSMEWSNPILGRTYTLKQAFQHRLRQLGAFGDHNGYLSCDDSDFPLVTYVNSKANWATDTFLVTALSAKALMIRPYQERYPDAALFFG